MKYKERKNVLTVNGTPKEIKSLMEELSKIVDNSLMASCLKDKIDSLETILEFEEFKIGTHHTLKYKSDSLIYSPNCSEDAKSFHYNIFKQFFDEAYSKLKF